MHKLFKRIATLSQLNIYYLIQEFVWLDDNQAVDVGKQTRKENIASLDCLARLPFNQIDYCFNKHRLLLLKHEI